MPPIIPHQRHSDPRRNHRRNPQALVQLASVPSKPECVNLPPMSAVTIWFALPVIWYIVGLEKISRRRFTHNTTWLGEERTTRILERQRVISHEQQMRFSQ